MGRKNRKKQRETRQPKKAFNKNPYQAGGTILNPKCEVKLKCNKTSFDKFKSKTVADPFYHQPLPPLKG